jgi:hypothetical protein
MDRENIIKEITMLAAPTSFGAWRIGLTHEPQECRAHWKDKEKKDISCWTTWKARSLSDARAIESYFVSVRGMRCATNGDDLSPSKPVFAYIF